jgi:hypothetical protein
LNIGEDNSQYNAGDLLDTELPDTDELLKSTPRAFTANYGQLKADEVKFYVSGSGLWFTESGVWLDFPLTVTEGRTDQNKGVVLKQEFLGAAGTTPIGREPVNQYSNFFLGSDPSGWCSEVPSYREVFYENLYTGIDLRYYISGEGLKYDFIVHPGASVDQIRMKYRGAQSLTVDENGNLLINTPAGTINDGELFIYQEYEGSRREISGEFVIYDKLEYGFEIKGDYNRDEALVIDPYIEYSTYIGGENHDVGSSITVDTSGRAYIIGYTMSTQFPVTSGAYEQTNKGNYDAYILKLSKNGTDLSYATFIGGDNDDYGKDIAVDSYGYVYTTGYTSSLDFPKTATISPKSHNDVFVVTLDDKGSKLIFSTTVGGIDEDYGMGIAIDTNDNVYVTGYTLSDNFPTSDSANDTTFNGKEDIFVFKLDMAAIKLVYSTFVGGSGEDYGMDIFVNFQGEALVTGYTMSGTFPTTPGVKFPSHSGFEDVIVFSLSGNGSEILFSTYTGGSDNERAYGLELDLYGNIYVAGTTASTNFPLPIAQTVYDTMLSGKTDAFIMKFNPTCSELIYSTYLGGEREEIAYDIDVDSSGNYYVTGITRSDDLLITQNSSDHSFNGEDDAFIIKLGPDGKRLEYSSFIGSPGIETSFSIDVDASRNIYITGYTDSEYFPTPGNTIDESYNKNIDIIALKLSFDEIVEINSATLFMDDSETNMICAGIGNYTFEVKITDTLQKSDLETVKLILDPAGEGIEVVYSQLHNSFSEESDQYDFVTVESTSKAYFDLYTKWIIYFDVTFDWEYPDENMNDIEVIVESAELGSTQKQFESVYQVENDLVFAGSLLVQKEDNSPLTENDYVMGGEKLSWSNLTVIYQGITDVYPKSGTYKVQITDQDDASWYYHPKAGQQIYIETITPKVSNSIGFNYKISIEDIPDTIETQVIYFMIKIDDQNLVFSNPTPSSAKWYPTNYIDVGITITDNHSGVDTSSIEFSYSLVGGTSWGGWVPVEKFEDVEGYDKGSRVIAQYQVTLADGPDNYIKWRAYDLCGNGPLESKAYNIKVNLEFIPKLGINLTLTPSTLNLQAGSEATVEAMVQNTGEFEDQIKLSLDYDEIVPLTCVIGDTPSAGNGTIVIQKYDLVTLQPGAEAIFYITVSADENAEHGDTVIITAKSKKFDEHGLDISESKNLIVNVLQPGEDPEPQDTKLEEKEEGSFLSQMLPVLSAAIVVVLIIIITLVIYLRMKKKKELKSKAAAPPVTYESKVSEGPVFTPVVSYQDPEGEQEKVIDMRQDGSGTYGEKKYRWGKD